MAFSDNIASTNRLWKTTKPAQQSSRCDSGLGSISLSGYSGIEQQPPRPKLIGGAQEELGEESGIYSGDIYVETDGNVAVMPPRAVDEDSAVSSTSQELESLAISVRRSQREMISERPPRQTTQKARGGRPSRVRRPQKNYSNIAMNNSRSSSPNAVHSMPDNSGTSLYSGVYSHGSLPQSWESSGYGTQLSGLSSMELFSGNSASGSAGLPSYGPSLDIYELQQNVQYFLPNRDGDTGFHLAVIHSEIDLLDKLLFIMSRDNRLRTVIDEQNNLYQTALHLATHTQQTEMIRKLLIAGASLNITDHKGNTPLHIAARFSSTKSLEEIIRYMSVQTILQVATIKNNEGLTCIHIAAKQGNMDILRKFKSLGVDVDMQDLNSGKTALHLAVEKGSLTDVQFMLETCRANINTTTYTGCTPLHIASGRGDITLTAYLLSMGANPDLVTDEGDTALDLSGSDQVMTLLTKAAALRWLY